MDPYRSPYRAPAALSVSQLDSLVASPVILPIQTEEKEQKQQSRQSRSGEVGRAIPTSSIIYPSYSIASTAPSSSTYSQLRAQRSPPLSHAASIQSQHTGVGIAAVSGSLSSSVFPSLSHPSLSTSHHPFHYADDHIKRRYLLALDFWHQKMCLKYFRQWKDSIEDRIERLKYGRTYFQLQRTSRLFQSWRLALANKARDKRKIIKAVEQWAAYRLRVFFHAWHLVHTHLHTHYHTILHHRTRHLFVLWYHRTIQRRQVVDGYVVWRKQMLRRRFSLIFHTWLTLSRHHRASRLLSTSTHTHILRRAYTIWRANTALVMKSREYWRKQVMWRSFQRLKRNCAHSQRKSSLHTIRTRYIYKQVLYYWYGQSVERMRIRRAVRWNYAQIVRAFYFAWRHEYISSKASRSATNLAVQFHHIHRRRAAIDVWRSYAAYKRLCGLVQGRVTQQVHAHLLHSAYHYWRSRHNLRIRLAMGTQRAAGHVRSRRIRVVLRAWRRLVMMVRHGSFSSSPSSSSLSSSVLQPFISPSLPTEARLAMGRAYAKNRIQRRCMSEWQILAHQDAQFHRQTRPISQHHYLVSCLRSWHAIAHKSILYREATMSMEDKQYELVLRQAFGSWRYLYAYSATHRAKCQLIEIGRTQPFYARWRRKYYVHCLLQDVMRRLWRRWLYAAYQQWYNALYYELRFLRLQHMIRQRAWFICWKKNSGVRIKLREYYEKIAQQRPTNVTRYFWQVWLTQYRYSRDLTVQALVCCMRQAVRSWHKRSVQRRVVRRIVHAFAERQDYLLLHHTLQGWKSLYAHLLESRTLSVRAAISKWHRWRMWRSKLRRMKTNAVVGAARSSLYRALDTWRQYIIARRYRRNQYNLAMIHRIQTLEHSMLRYWRKYIKGFVHGLYGQADTFYRSHTLHFIFSLWLNKFHMRAQLRIRFSRMMPFLSKPDENICIQIWRKYARNHKAQRIKMRKFQQVSSVIYTVYRRHILLQFFNWWYRKFEVSMYHKQCGEYLAARHEQDVRYEVLMQWHLHTRAIRAYHRTLKQHAVQLFYRHAYRGTMGRQYAEQMDAKKAKMILQYWYFQTMKCMELVSSLLSSAYSAYLLFVYMLNMAMMMHMMY